MMSEPTNADRAAWVQTALEAFARETGQTSDLETGDAGDTGEVLMDLLCDISHFCDAHTLDLGELLRKAHTHYLAELEIVPPETAATCPLCTSTHPASEGITLYHNEYEHCGITWSDDWCCGVDDECSKCGADISPTESTPYAVIEAPKEGATHGTTQR